MIIGVDIIHSQKQDNEKKNKANEKICISLPSELIKAIDEKRDLVPRSTFISNILDKDWLEKEKKEQKEEQS